MTRHFVNLALTAVLSATGALADPATYRAGNDNDVRYQIAIPESSASSGSGNIYFQLSAPRSYEWVGLGSGSRMANSNLFLMYEDGNGSVTVSPRRADSYTMPLPVENGGAEIELLPESGLFGDIMVANVMCSNCESWGSESMAFDNDRSQWIAAWRSGDAVESMSLDARISKHDATQNFRVDLTRSTISQDSNPFTGTNAGSEDSGNSDAVDDSEEDEEEDGGAGSPGGNNNNNNDAEGSDGENSDATSDEETPGVSGSVLLAHGVVMTVVWVILYPFGSIFMPVLGSWLIHAGWQMVAFFGMWAGFGLGVVYAQDHGYLFQQGHTILGTVVVALMVFQPALGVAHHMYFNKHHSRGIVSHVHIWFGRIVMALGILNGGLGLRLAGSHTAWVIAYSVLAGIMLVLYILGLFSKRWLKRQPARPARSTRPAKNVSPQSTREGEVGHGSRNQGPPRIRTPPESKEAPRTRTPPRTGEAPRSRTRTPPESKEVPRTREASRNRTPPRQ